MAVGISQTTTGLVLIREESDEGAYDFLLTPEEAHAAAGIIERFDWRAPLTIENSDGMICTLFSILGSGEEAPKLADALRRHANEADQQRGRVA